MWIDAKLGVRRWLTPTLFAGLPLLASFREAVPGSGAGSWSLGAALELGVAF